MLRIAVVGTEGAGGAAESAEPIGSLLAVSLARTYSKRVAAAFALALGAALAALALAAVAPASAASCPTFRVLHNDRIGAASLPAGNYEVKVKAGLSCEEGSKLFARFRSASSVPAPSPSMPARGSAPSSSSRVST